MKVVVLDAGPLGLATHPIASPENEACRAWLRELLAHNVEIVIAEIADYEVRRELLRGQKRGSIRRLDELRISPGFTFEPITTDVMLQAAEFWALARRQGRPTADPQALDCDAILAAQAEMRRRLGQDVIVASSNVRHLSRFVPAAEWRHIPVL